MLYQFKMITWLYYIYTLQITCKGKHGHKQKQSYFNLGSKYLGASDNQPAGKNLIELTHWGGIRYNQ